MPLPVQTLDGGIQFAATIQPRASRNEIAGIHNDTLKLKLTSPPVDGAANKLCLRFLAKTLGIAPSRISIVSGANSRHKILRIDAMDAGAFRDKLKPWLGAGPAA